MKIPLPLVPLFEPIRPEMERMERLIYQVVSRVEEPLSSVLCRLLIGGKRIRPAMVILAGRVFKKTAAPMLNLAVAIEALHMATLIHDDLIDEGPLRHSRKTLHTIWPAGATVLAGDYLLSRALSLVTELRNPRIVRVIADAVSVICAGELRQMFVTKGKLSRRQEYYRSVEAKTATLFAAATEAAALLAGAREKQRKALRRYGRELGMAFQIVDDVLDFIGDEAQLGKQVGSDLRQGLITLPTLYYLERVKNQTLVRTVLSGKHGEEQVAAAIAAIRNSGAIEIALEEARVFARRSRRALAALPDTPARQMLAALADYVVLRRW